ncbi:MAG: glucosaminidase domain-containing protein [Solirubrobacteraceae bacterium]|nr:glucosaminidase domain-containing protein [Solirubrobacteraceae bacterium]
MVRLALVAALLALILPASASAVVSTTTGNANLRSAPGGGKVLAKLKVNTRVSVSCVQIGGIGTTKRDGASRIWSRVTVGTRRGWVADGLLNGSTQALAAPICGIKAATSPAAPGVLQGTCGIVAPVILVPPFPTPESFITAALPGARKSRDTYKVPVSVTLAQGILETGGGKIAALANNFFGMKAQATATRGVYRWEANAVGCVLKKTREAERGRLVLTVGAFRAYTSLDQSILDHGARLTANPVYAPAFEHTDDPERFLREVAKRYATDPKYATKLLELIKRYDLGQYD